MSTRSKILFVCKGNLYRSALAEALFRRIVEQDDHLSGLGLEIRSAGSHATKGKSPREISLRHGEQLGLDITLHRATPVADAVGWADMAVCMERTQRDLVKSLRPDLAAYLLPYFTTGDPDQEVTDPAGPDAEELFVKSLDEIRTFLPALAQWLRDSESQ